MRLDLGLLILRVFTGGFMFFFHGLGKITGFSMYAAQFPDPLGLGSQPSLILATFAEGFCSILVMIGLATRLAVIPLVTTMCVAAFIVHNMDPIAKKEFALLYAIPFLALAFTGPGMFSLDFALKDRVRFLRP